MQYIPDSAATKIAADHCNLKLCAHNSCFGLKEKNNTSAAEPDLGMEMVSILSLVVAVAVVVVVLTK